MYPSALLVIGLWSSAGATARWCQSVAVVSLEDDRAVVASQADVVAQRVPDRVRGRLGHDPEVAIGVEVAVVDRRWDALLCDGLHGGERLEGACGAHHVAGHRLRAADRERRPVASRPLAEDRPDRLRLTP